MEAPPIPYTDTTSANRQIKDGVFRLLFDEPKNAAELYYALSGNRCSPDEIQIITLSTTISGELKNDLAFVAKGKILVVGEHMASPYANMPVRLLMYAGLLYEKWIKMKGEEGFLYRSKLYKIPTPSFVVFYNGTALMPEKELLRLSSAFETTADKDFGLLELEVPVYNINKGMNNELFSKSPHLRQYAEFISKLRELTRVYDYTKAVRETVLHCIANDILAKFLKEQGGKIVSLLSTYDPEVARRVYAEECLEEKTMQIAKNLLSMGLSKEQISQATGLSIDEILVFESELY
ncbi:MAG: hypothetical protein FWG87_06840 [Defluviitaleaceae bacterium]|nr:hypothetical protein [Defluviitaleaceae bacterium]